MMGLHDPGAGTTEQPAADGNPGTAPTGEDDLNEVRERNRKLEEEKAQWLAEKETLERVKRENEELRANRAPTNATPGPDAREMLRLRIQELQRQAADPGDPRQALAQAALDHYRADAEQAQMTFEDRAYQEIPEAMRQDTRNFYERNRNMFASPKAAYWAMLGQNAEKSSAKDREADDAEKKGKERRDAAPDLPVGGLPPGDGPVGTAVFNMKRSEYIRRLDAGESHLVAMRDNGKINVLDD